MRMMVSVTYSPDDRERAMPLIPAEQERAGELMRAGSLEALYLAAETLGGSWLVMRGADEATMRRDLESLPLHPFMRVTLVPLSD